MKKVMEHTSCETRKAHGILFVVLLFFAFGLLQCQSGENKNQTETKQTEIRVAEKTSCAVVGDLSSAISEVAKKTVPAVVHIEIRQSLGILAPDSLFGDDDSLGEHQGPEILRRELRGVGSGVVLDGQGRILTNNHVVAGAREIKVVLADGRSYEASVVGTDQKTDLAVIRINSDGILPHVTFGDSDRISVGDWVVAIGHPRGLDQTVTQGIISAKHRRGILDPGTYYDYLQTDAAINPGNSGGPLLNLKGEVIGLNSAIASGSGGSEGIGFAIPSNVAVRIAKALISDGKVRRGWLGVSIQESDPEYSGIRGFYDSDEKGVTVANVSPESPAADGAIEKGDIIVRYGGRSVDKAADLQKMVAETPIGDKVAIDLIRRGETKEIVVGIGSLEMAIRNLVESVKRKIGGTIRPVTMDESRKFGLPSSIGVAVVSIEPFGLLERAGFQKGDIVLAINSQIVHGVEGFASILHDLSPETVLTVLALDSRNGETRVMELGSVD